MNSVLIVDDEAEILKLVSENLLIRGYQVMEAKNGREALNQLRNSPPSLMVLDIKLPDFSGWELLKRIKTDPLIPNVFPVLVMTASITDANIKLDTYPNVVEILIKPFNVTNLVKIVKRILNS
jgi:two-component system, OmpR family, alkaline phosphatase synthesis response regulator PhoP